MQKNARRYLYTNLQAMEHFHTLSVQILCDFEEKTSIMYSLQELNIFENTFVLKLDGTTAITEKRRIHTKKMIIATHLWGMTTPMAASEILIDLVLERKNEFTPAFAPNRSMLTGQLFANIGTTLLDFVTPTIKRCSHLGCALQWNSLEYSRDCPCHASRFDKHGRLMDNPATKDSHVE